MDMSWAREEMFGVNLGDSRLNKRAIKLLETLGGQPTESLPSACKSWKETIAAYRFFYNESIKSEKILEPHKKMTIERVQKHKVVLCLQDTTELDFSSKKKIRGLGYLRYKTQHGMYLHPILAVTPKKVPLGLLDAKLWSRNNDEYGKSLIYDRLRIEEKESFRWIEGYRKICKFQEELPNTELIYVADREGDIYDFFLEDTKLETKNKPSWIVRACYNRNLANGKKLFESLEEAPILGKIEFDIAKTKKREARHVVQTLQMIEVTLKAPKRTGYKLPNTKVTAILAEEKNPPKDEERLRWILLTKKIITSFEDALEIVKFYLCRWEIEVFFRTLKSGCKVEQLQLETASRLENAISFYLIVAWRVMLLSRIARDTPKEPCSLILEDEEWQILCVMFTGKKPPKKAPPIGQIIRMLASFGGYLNRKNDPPPGPKSIWTGLQKLKDFIFASMMLQKVEGRTYV